MNRLRRNLLTGAIVALGIVFTPYAGTGADEAGENPGKVRFLWAFGAQVGPEGGRRLVSITRDTILQTGDRLKMLVHVQSPCFVYVIHRGPLGEVSLLSPERLRQPVLDIRMSAACYFPEHGAWLELDDRVGRETFYLLASSERLAELERRIGAYESAGPSDKPGLAGAILAHIRELRKRYHRFSTVAKRPASVAAALRGPSRELAGMALAISAERFYGKAFTIEHR